MPKKPKFSVGQKIVIRTSGMNAVNEPYRFDEIVNVGKTQIKTSDGSRWMIESRRKVGDSSFYSERLALDSSTFNLMTVAEAEKLNAEWRDENEVRIMRTQIRNVQWGERYVTDEKIKKVHAFLKAEGIL